jgi:hypothetical protein
VEVSEVERAFIAEINGRRFRFTAQIAGDDPKASHGDWSILALLTRSHVLRLSGKSVCPRHRPLPDSAPDPIMAVHGRDQGRAPSVLVDEREAIEVALSRPWIGESRRWDFGQR